MNFWQLTASCQKINRNVEEKGFGKAVNFEVRKLSQALRAFGRESWKPTKVFCC